MNAQAAHFVGLVPARGGSKRIPGKNLAMCGGAPLLSHTADAALASKRLAETYVSTDDSEIAQFAKAAGLSVPFMRPAQLADDSADMASVLNHFLDWLEESETPCDAIVLLQPTSPLRTHMHIDSAIDRFIDCPEAESLVSVSRVSHIHHPYKLQVEKDGYLEPFSKGTPQGPDSSNFPPVFFRNGPAILIMRPENIRQGSLYHQPCLPYEMPMKDSVDIDTPYDLLLADFLLRHRQSEHVSGDQSKS